MASAGQTLRTGGASTGLVAEAVRHLGSGGLVAAASESGYLVCSALVTGSRRGATELTKVVGKWGTTTVAPVPPAAWLSPTTERVERALHGSLDGLGRRLVGRLAPGPVVFLVGVQGGEATAVRAGHESVIDTHGWLGVRVSGSPNLSAIAARFDGTIACVEIPERGGKSLFLGGGCVSEPAREAESAAGELKRIGLTDAFVLDDGPVRSRAGTTVIELARRAQAGEAGAGGGAGYRVVHAGAYEPRFIEKQVMWMVLFVCSGNTCRSPMAEAIAAGQVARDASLSAFVRVASAGTGAGPGHPATAEAVKAVGDLGYSLGRHSSRPLTRRMIAEADVIYGMTRSHVSAVMDLDPSAAEKTRTLDPKGKDIADPIGQGQDVYTETARRVEELVRLRLKELGS